MNAIQFGNKEHGIEYFNRPSVYAVIFNDKDEIGIVEKNGLYFLPGGGIEQGEKAIDALLREVREETGIEVQIEKFLGNANEYLVSFDKTVKFNQIGSFYKCEIVTDHKDQSDLTHEFKWLNITTIESKIARRSHLWILNVSLYNTLFRFKR